MHNKSNPRWAGKAKEIPQITANLPGSDGKRPYNNGLPGGLLSTGSSMPYLSQLFIDSI